MASNERIRNYYSKATGQPDGTLQDLERKFFSIDPIDTTWINDELDGIQTAINNLPQPPSPSITTPISVAVDGVQGTSETYARSDHTHAARVQRRILTLDASGLATWTFTRAFTAEPSLQYMVFQSTGDPIVVEAQSWVMNGANYTGVVVKGYRSRPLPALATITGTLLTDILTPLNNRLGLLNNFNLFGGASLTGVKVHMSAGDQM